MEGMDVDSHSSRKRSKMISGGKDIVIFYLEESNNQTKQAGKGGCLIQEERSHQSESFDASSSEQTISQFAFQSQPPAWVLNLQSSCYIDVNAS